MTCCIGSDSCGASTHRSFLFSPVSELMPQFSSHCFLPPLLFFIQGHDACCAPVACIKGAVRFRSQKLEFVFLTSCNAAASPGGVSTHPSACSQLRLPDIIIVQPVGFIKSLRSDYANLHWWVKTLWGR